MKTGLDGSEETSNLGSYYNSSGVGFKPVCGGQHRHSLPRRTKCNGYALLFWEQVERFDSDVFHHSPSGRIVFTSYFCAMVALCLPAWGYCRK